MGLYELLFPKKAVEEVTTGYFKTLTAYQPVFHSFSGGLYEAELCRSAIHAFAEKILEYQPNPYMDTTKFLYKLATILEAENTAFIAPIYDDYFQKIIGFYPVQPSEAEVREKKDGTPCLVFKFARGKNVAIEFDRVGIMNKFFYKDAFFGESNRALHSALDLMYTQQEGIKEGIKQSATIRFLAKLQNTLKPADLEAERKRWVSTNLSKDNQGGIALFDAKYSDVKPIESKPYVVDPDQIKVIQESVYKYFGVNEQILENKFTSEEWAAYYEAKVEPFALQLSLVLTNMLFTSEQKVRGNSVQFTANRLQYASTSEKLAVVQQLTDRGIMNRNEAREVFNMEPIDGGDNYIIRGEYYNADLKIEDAPTGEGENNE